MHTHMIKVLYSDLCIDTSRHEADGTKSLSSGRRAQEPKLPSPCLPRVRPRKSPSGNLESTVIQ